MSYRSIKGVSGFGQLGILIAFTGVGLVLAGVVQYLIGKQIVPAGTQTKDFADAVTKALLKPEHVSYARLSQVLGTFFIMFIPVILYLVICHGRNGHWLGFNRFINARQVLVGFFLILFANILAGPLADFSHYLVAYFPELDAFAKKMEVAYSDQVASLTNLKSWGELVMVIFIMAFIPALFEELFFRGAVQNLLERWWRKPLLALIVTSVFFSLIHMSVYLFLSRLALGLVLGLMFQRSKNIWVNITAHFLNNAMAVIQLFVMAKRGKTIGADKLDPQISIALGILGLGAVIGLFYLFEKYSSQNRVMIAVEEQNLLEGNEPFRSIAQN